MACLKFLLSSFLLNFEHLDALNGCRMKGKKATEMKAAVKELEQSIHMVKAPSVLKEDPSLSLPKLKVKVVQSTEANVQMEE